jgi:diaminohydroxyphosphoribosylaminopyrimidine deaminase/5-amino-6-(5-phosphoribosylamino)uracil reductase
MGPHGRAGPGREAAYDQLRMPAAVTQQDRVHLRRALELAEGGRGRVSPNPLVGAVLVRDGEAIGEGFHAELGGPHAEVAALEDCLARGHAPSGATLYVTLEPCAHQGRQPPCTNAILAAGVRRVVIASEDPSEKASGRGPGILRDEGIEVELANGEEAAAARLLNQPFRKHSRTSRPLVVLKSALSLDGRVATAGGDSRWISGEASRALAHRWRAECDAVCVGIGTALADDPLLTARRPADGAALGAEAEDAAGNDVRQPTRVVFDSKARLPLDSRLVGSIAEAPLLVIASPAAPAARIEALEKAGAEVVVCDGDPQARVAAALAGLGRREITSMLLEGGPTLAGSFLDAGEVDELRLFIAPIVLGGAGARPLAGGEGAPLIADATPALSVDWERSDGDLLVRARLREW